MKWFLALAVGVAALAIAWYLLRPRSGTQELPPEVANDITPKLDNARPGLQVSALGKSRGIKSPPLLVLCEKPVYAIGISNQTTLDTFWMPSIGWEGPGLDGLVVCGVLAMSPPDEPGTASALIRVIKEKFPNVPAIYGGWNYDLDLCAPHALECGADRVLLPAVDSNELAAFVLSTLSEHAEDPTVKPSLERYRRFLELHCPTSATRIPEYAKGLPPSKNW